MFFLRKRKYQIISVVCLFVFLIIIFLLFSDIGYKRLKPGQEIKLTVDPKTNQVDYNSTLRIYNENGISLKVSDSIESTLWHDLSTDIYYDINTKKKTTFTTVDGKVIEEEIPISKADYVDLSSNDFIIKFTGEKTFDVTNNKKYKIKIKNMSNRSGKISAVVENQ